MNTKKSLYALYRGDTFIAIGYKSDLASLMGMKRSTFESCVSQAKKGLIKYENSLITVKIEEENKNEFE